MEAFDAVRAAQGVTEGQIYNVGGGPENTVSLLELIDEIELLTGQKIRYELDQRRPGDQLIYITDTAKLNRATGWRPRHSVRDTLNLIHAWWKKNRQLFADPVLSPVSAGSFQQQVPGAVA
jgi:CDP-paratose 2-epimerase